MTDSMVGGTAIIAYVNELEEEAGQLAHELDCIDEAIGKYLHTYYVKRDGEMAEANACEAIECAGTEVNQLRRRVRELQAQFRVMGIETWREGDPA